MNPGKVNWRPSEVTIPSVTRNISESTEKVEISTPTRVCKVDDSKLQGRLWGDQDFNEGIMAVYLKQKSYN
jgi:hypothetical protein